MYRINITTQCVSSRALVSFILALATVSSWADTAEIVAAGVRQAKGSSVRQEVEARASLVPMLLAANALDDAKPASRESLFDDDEPELGLTSESESALKAPPSSSGVKGFLQFEMARTVAAPAHWSKAMTRADLSSQGNLGGGVKWKLGARIDYDAVYSLYDYYPGPVERDQRFAFNLRENYLDIGAGDWDFRLGKQHVVWG